MAHTAKSRKAKGVRLEKMFADQLVNAGLDPYAKRMVLSGAVRGFDGDILTKLPIHVECKNQSTWSPLAYYKQCSLSNPLPARKMNLVIMGKGGTNQYQPLESYAFLKTDDLIELMAYALKGGWE